MGKIDGALSTTWPAIWLFFQLPMLLLLFEELSLDWCKFHNSNYRLLVNVISAEHVYTFPGVSLPQRTARGWVQGWDHEEI